MTKEQRIHTFRRWRNLVNKHPTICTIQYLIEHVQYGNEFTVRLCEINSTTRELVVVAEMPPWSVL